MCLGLDWVAKPCKDESKVLGIVKLVAIIKTYEGEAIAAEKPGFITSHHHHDREIDAESTGNTPGEQF